MTNRWGALTLAVSASLLLVGCAPESSVVVTTPSPTSDSSQKPAAEVDFDAEFRTIVDASCDKAYEIGVTETLVGKDSRLVLVPQSEAYNDFTAAVVNDAGGITPIWSTEEFAVCIDSINFSMSEDGGSTYAIAVSGDLAAGTLRSEYSVEDYGTFITDYVIVDGLITEVTSQTPGATTVKTIRYGMPSDVDIEHFRKAIDLFMASE